MLIHTMPEVLTWADMNTILAQIHDSYIEKLSDHLGVILGGITKEDESKGECLTSLVQSLPDEAMVRVLSAPETSYRLLWADRHELNNTEAFLKKSFQAELLRIGSNISITEETWTALGDTCFYPDHSVFSAPRIESFMPLDFDSPYAINLDLNGMQEKSPIPRDGLDMQQKQLVLDRLASAQRKIGETRSHVLDFVVVFTKALVLQKDPEAPESFSSGSSGQYVGRSVLANPHLESIADPEITEGLVHEAIHSLLYMQEQIKAWVYDRNLYGPTLRTVSPWTGNALALRPYLQASFVWYGLLHFWCIALAHSTFDRHKVKGRISQAASGFLGQPLLDQVNEYRSEICPDLLDALERMQAQVASSFAQA